MHRPSSQALNTPQLQQCLQTCWYTLQLRTSSELATRAQADVNVSLTAISLLWNAADLVGKGQAGRAAPGSAADEHAQPADQDASQSEALLRQLLSALQVWLSLARCMPCLSPFHALPCSSVMLQS